MAPLDHYLPFTLAKLNPKKGARKTSTPQVYFHFYPELKEKIADVQNSEKRVKAERTFFTDLFKENRQEMENARPKIQNVWDGINRDVMQALSDIMEIGWPATDKKFTANITLNPICPRYLKSRSFDVFFRDERNSINTIEMIAVHEILHFIYFEKWKEVFPETDEAEFNTPHLVWKLSEMVPAILLNDVRMQNIVKLKFRCYTEFEQCMIGKRHLLSYLQEFYDLRKSMADFLTRSWEFVRAHRNEIP